MNSSDGATSSKEQMRPAVPLPAEASEGERGADRTFCQKPQLSRGALEKCLRRPPCANAGSYSPQTTTSARLVLAGTLPLKRSIAVTCKLLMALCLHCTYDAI